MTRTTLACRGFNQDTSRAKKAAAEGPVFITERGKPDPVLLCIEDYQRITGKRRSIADARGGPAGVEDIALKFPRFREPARPPDLS